MARMAHRNVFILEAFSESSQNRARMLLFYYTRRSREYAEGVLSLTSVRRLARVEESL